MVPMQNNRIRPIVLGMVQDGDRLFVAESFDPATRKPFYRALGGGIEFGETSLDALKREFWEEIQAELTNIEYLCCLENLFIYNGKPGHEIVQLYRCDLADPKFYAMQQVTVQEGNQTEIAYWIAIDEFKSGQRRLVPEPCLNYL
jgi:8-oxo-dGTP pyrophosphatase MutT (NUDIX family)